MARRDCVLIALQSPDFFGVDEGQRWGVLRREVGEISGAWVVEGQGWTDGRERRIVRRRLTHARCVSSLTGVESVRPLSVRLGNRPWTPLREPQVHRQPARPGFSCSGRCFKIQPAGPLLGRRGRRGSGGGRAWDLVQGKASSQRMRSRRMRWANNGTLMGEVSYA